MVSVAAHKLHGPKGVGALVVRKGLAWPALFSGRQERQRRGGTENLPGIVGFAAAAARAGLTLDSDLAHMRRLQVRLEAGLSAGLPGCMCTERARSVCPTPVACVSARSTPSRCWASSNEPVWWRLPVRPAQRAPTCLRTC